MIVVLLGPPGSGKGTQAQKLVAHFDGAQISTGDALREEIKRGSSVGLKAKELMDGGRLVPDELLFEILVQALERYQDKKLVLLDGYPRTLTQAQTLETLSSRFPLGAVIHFQVDQKELLIRLSGRRTCSSCQRSYHVVSAPSQKEGVCDHCQGALIQRPDDEEKKVAVRLEVYNQQTMPLVQYYRQRQICHDVNGSGQLDHVFSDITAILQKALEK